MNSLLDKMFITRFCLPTNTDTDLYKNDQASVSQCFCATYNHVACLLRRKNDYEKG